MKSAFTPTRARHERAAFAVNSGPFSERMCAGTPRVTNDLRLTQRVDDLLCGVPLARVAQLEAPSLGPTPESATLGLDRGEGAGQTSLLVAQQDRLLNLRLGGDIDQHTFARKHTELRNRLASIKLQLDALDRSQDETAELASKASELSQTLRDQWVTADYSTKRRILEIVCLNCRLDGETAVFTTRKPFDVLVEGLHLVNNRGDRI